jgi:hypothetical protein
MRYYVFLPNTNLHIYLDLNKLINQYKSTRYELLTDYLASIFSTYETPHEQLFQLLNIVFESIDTDLSIEKNILESDFYIQGSIEQRERFLHDLRTYLKDNVFKNFRAFYKSICYFDLYYLLIGFSEYLFQYYKSYVYDSDISDYVLKFKFRCSNCQKENHIGITLKELLLQNKLYILPRDRIVNIQNQLFSRNYEIQITLKPITFPPAIYELSDTIENIPIHLKNNKQLQLRIDIKPFSIYALLYTPEFSKKLVHPDFNSIDTVTTYLNLITHKIRPVKDFHNDQNITSFQKLSAFYKKLPPDTFKDYLIPQFHKKFTKYIPIHFIRSLDHELYLLQNENLFKVECAHCKTETKNYFSVNILDLINKITTDFSNKYETKITYETLSLNIRTEHNYNDLIQTGELKYKHIIEYKKQLDEYYKKYIQELKKRQKRKL